MLPGIGLFLAHIAAELVSVRHFALTHLLKLGDECPKGFHAWPVEIVLKLFEQ